MGIKLNFFLLLFIILTQITTIYAKNIEIGCNILSKHEEESCEEETFLKEEHIFKLNSLNIEQKKTSIISKKKEFINITEELSSINILYKQKEIKIVRKATKRYQSCPPNCIQPIHIKNIRIVGTLETLNFINNLGKNKRMLLVDARSSKFYKKNTIPTATNIPYNILKKESKHSTIILTLLGAKKEKKKWNFKNVHTLLIFDNGSLDVQSTQIIDRLIEIGYPQNKILYYYGGISEWSKDGLTTI